MANWCVDHDGRQQLVLSVYGGRDVDGCECFAIELTTELAATFLHRMDRLRAAQVIDPDLHASSYRSHHGNYYGLDDQLRAPSPTDSDDLIPRWQHANDDAATDTHARSTTADGIRWTAQLTHADRPVLLSTETLRDVDLQLLVAGLNPWTTAPAPTESDTEDH